MQNNHSLRKDARYSINSKALRRWGEDRLQITYLEDRCVEAVFLYEGTTCSNFGHQLLYQYVVKLAPAASGFKILAMYCDAAAGDAGHKKMCEFIKDAASLKQQIEDEKPLLGRSLDEVLDWSRAYSPEGCFCKQESRMHKWGAVLETIHYAMANLEISLD